MMNNYFKPNILIFLLLIVIALISGCGQSTFADSSKSPTLVSEEILLTPTFPPCLPLPQASSSEFVNIANDWFQSSQPSITSRNKYNYDSNHTERIWNRFCENFQTAILNKEPWLDNPIDIALRLAGYPNGDYWYPDTITAHYRKHSPYIVTVVIVVTGLLDDSVGASDIRVDLVFTEEKWHVQWFGFRQQCIRDNIDGWVTNPCQ
jgi:hypothetical protein